MIRKPVLLVVDDDAGMRAVLTRFGTGLGFSVVSDDGAGDAIARICGMSLDAALVDVCMPEIGGLDVLRAIRGAQPRCRVILMTGLSGKAGAIEAAALGAMDYIGKPLDLDRLRRLLAEVADAHAAASA